MTLLRRAPRSVYRAYDEEEFLAGAALDEMPSSQTVAPVARRSRRLLGAMLPAAVTGVLVGLLAITGLRSIEIPSQPVPASGADTVAGRGAPRRPAATLPARLGSAMARSGVPAHVARRPGRAARRVRRGGELGARAALAAASQRMLIAAEATAPSPGPAESEFGFER
jgi:hypothetical protein